MNNDNVAAGKQERMGWIVLAAVAALLTLNGVGWFFVGPSLEFFDPSTGTVEQFRADYPVAADNITTNARQVAIWFIGFGLMSLMLAWHGFRMATPLAWCPSWFLVLSPAGVGVNVLVAGEGGFGGGMIVVGIVALAGLLLARPRSRADAPGRETGGAT